MAIASTAVWRCRKTGSNLNGAGYDPAITGGTDYSQQDAAALTRTDLAAAADSTTLTSGGGFTSAMVGNAIQITAGTNFVAGFYIITAVASATSVTLDRSPTTSGNAMSGATGRVGGAVVDLVALFGGAQSSTSSVQPLNTVYVRGSGSIDPAAVDYSYGTANQNFNFGGASQNKLIRIVGENGRPHVTGWWNMQYVSWENIKFTNQGGNQYGSAFTIQNGALLLSKFDRKGYNITVVSANNCTIALCEFFSSASTPPDGASNETVYIYQPLLSASRCLTLNCYIHDNNTNCAMSTSDDYATAQVSGCVFANNAGAGALAMFSSNRGTAFICGNTFYNNQKFGLGVGTYDISGDNGGIYDNIFVGHTGVGSYGLLLASGANPTTVGPPGDAYRFRIMRNYFFNNANHVGGLPFNPLYDTVLAADPFVAAASGNFALSAALPADLIPGTATLVRSAGAAAVAASGGASASTPTRAEVYNVA